MLTTTDRKPAQPNGTPEPLGEGVVAAEAFYEQYAPLLRNIALTRFRIPRQDVEALINDVFATYIGHAPKVQSVRAYLVAAICNAARQFHRNRQKDESLVRLDVSVLRSHEEGIADAVTRKLFLASVLSRVNGRCRELLRRYYLEEESTASIAADRNTTSDYVLILLHNCRKHARSVCQRLVEGRR